MLALKEQIVARLLENGYREAPLFESWYDNVYYVFEKTVHTDRDSYFSFTVKFAINEKKSMQDQSRSTACFSYSHPTDAAHYPRWEVHENRDSVDIEGCANAEKYMARLNREIENWLKENMLYFLYMVATGEKE